MPPLKADRTVKAEIDALVGHPDGFHIQIGQPVLHVPSGRSGRLIHVNNGIAVMRDPSGIESSVRFDELDAFGEVVSPSDIGAPEPGSRQGGYGGAPASHSKAVAFSTPEGQLALAKATIQRGSPMARAAATIPLRKGGSPSRRRGEKVRNLRTGEIGVVLQSGILQASVEYTSAHKTTVMISNLADLESA